MKYALNFILVLFFTLSLQGQSLLDTKLCIDPGHGGYDPANDRYIEETGFWESYSNLDKAFYLKERLEGIGATVILTRVGNENEDDIALSARSAIANANNVDFFHSIHSNGFQGTANYTLMLFRGYDNQPVFPEAKQMGTIMADEIFKANRTTNKYNRGDWTFYGSTSGLGVLRNLEMPGVLSEGSFHDYIPESWRLMSTTYHKHEAISMVRSFLRYFSAGSYTTGTIAGIARDPDEIVSYYYLNTNDSKRPVNNLQVRIEPGGQTFQGDALNNGFYLFTGLEPGAYKIYLEGEYFAYDSVQATVYANRTTFADKFLTMTPILDAPSVTSIYPEDGAEEIVTGDQIEIEFDIRMDRTSTQAAFDISPNTSGYFHWSNDDKNLVFEPYPKLALSTNYTIEVAASAQSHFGVNIAEAVSIGFKTRTKLAIDKQYPENNQEDLSNTAAIRLQFNAVLNGSSLPGNIGLYDSQNNFINVSVTSMGDQDGVILFEPSQPLDFESEYMVKLGGGITDIEGLSLGDDIEISFVTGAEFNAPGVLVEDFESPGAWSDPDADDESFGTSQSRTYFDITGLKEVTGESSAIVEYKFIEMPAQIVFATSQKPLLGNNPDAKFGMWVFGDDSDNEISFLFTDEMGNSAEVPMGLIDFTGWVYLSTTLGETGITGNIYFRGMKIKRTETGLKESAVWFDAIHSDDYVSSVEDKQEEKSFMLAQNYPNPFNPSTTISFSIAEAGKVNLTVYNILGQKVAVLMNGNLSSGRHEIKFDASALSSGIYFYRLKSRDYALVKKMILLK